MVRWVAPMVGVLAALAASAGAQPDSEATHASLTFVPLEGADGCLTQAELATQVRSEMGQAVWSTEAGVRVDGWIIRRRAPHTGFVAGVAFLGADGQVLRRGMVRTSETDCRVLDRDLTRLVAGTLQALLSLPEAPAHAAEEAHVESGPGFNPYLSEGRPQRQAPRPRARRPDDEPLPNPYEGRVRPERELRTFFNPYRGSASVVARNGNGHAGSAPGTPAANPYLGPAPPPSDPSANPYRP